MPTVPQKHVSHGGPGKADINVGFRPNDNDRFILHDSEGFEPGEDAKFKTVMDFIDERSKKPDLGERLHAIWWVTYYLLRVIRYRTYVLFRICISIPVAGDRVAEIGVEQIIKMVHGRGEFHVINSEPRALKYRHAVPLIIVFTKYDMLVTRIIFRATRSGSDEQVWENAEREANSVFEELCVVPIDEMLNREVPNANLSVPIKKVSGRLMSPFDISGTDGDGSPRYP
jgi:hypothetical protein